MSRSNANAVPRATIHKQILTAAAADPDATMDELASQVSGATLAIVERVLDEYGDPVSDAEEPPEDQSMEDRELPSIDELTEKQLETLRAVGRWPDASQRELASELGVTCATVNKRVNSIASFEWDRREEIVGELLDAEDARENGHEAVIDVARADDQGVSVESSAAVGAPTLAVAEASNGAIETTPGDENSSTSTRAAGQVGSRDEGDRAAGIIAASVPERGADRGPAGSLFEDPDLTSRILHACMTYDGIAPDEEVRILRAFVDSGRGLSTPGEGADGSDTSP